MVENKNNFMYQCYDCGKDVENTTGEHYEIHFVKGVRNKHTILSAITLCEECFTKRKLSMKDQEE